MTHDHRQDVTEQALSDPTRRQVGHGQIAVLEPFRRGHDSGAIDQRIMGENDGFGGAGGA
jgi:hypothetical protein